MAGVRWASVSSWERGVQGAGKARKVWQMEQVARCENWGEARGGWDCDPWAPEDFVLLPVTELVTCGEGDPGCSCFSGEVVVVSHLLPSATYCRFGRNVTNHLFPKAKVKILNK